MSLCVIGLISGGKDSLFSLAHCQQNGHKLVALANLYPNNTAKANSRQYDSELPDLDSFMYQTVGHSVVPLYAEALGVPLYRRPISGTAMQNGRYYDTGSRMEMADEIEDMYALIKEIIEHHPEANALNAGAILSTYQRTRVESVAVRLGLVPLAYLWQYPALPPPASRKDSLTGLLDDMEVSRCEARIIKIASGGIHADMSFSDVTNVHTRAKLVSGMTPFFVDIGQEFWLRGAVLGEGGEYETLALDGPAPLWKKRIRIDTNEAYEAGGGAVYVRLGRASLVERQAEQIVVVPKPTLLDERFAAVKPKAAGLIATLTVSKNLTPAPMPEVANIDQLDLSSNWNESYRTIQIFNLTSSGLTAAEQLDRVIQKLPGVLSNIARLYKISESSLGAETLVSATLLLQSMEDFASVNQIYTTKLWPQGLSNPPARVTVAASLPRGAKVSISLIYDVADIRSRSRKGLHVQSRSYWAPANIGPYSQAISVPAFTSGSIEIVHLAGQIPLVPATMAMLDACFIDQAVLALQHLWRVAQERGVDQWIGAGIAFLAHTNTTEQDDSLILQRAQEAARMWKWSHYIDEKGCDIHGEHLSTETGTHVAVDEGKSDDEDVDLWDLQQRSWSYGTTSRKITVGEHLHKLPQKIVNAEAQGEFTLPPSPPFEVPCFIAAQVNGLPRNAPIEWWSTGITELVSMAGAQTPKVSAVSTTSKHPWTLSGISVEAEVNEQADETQRGSSDSDESEARSSQHKSSYFVTMRINSSIKIEEVQLVPGSLEALIPYLLQGQESRESFSWQFATAHSFINLSCPVAVTLQEKLDSLQRSCVILCDHVWSSGLTQPKSSEGFEASDFTEPRVKQTLEGHVANSNSEIKEVAAALVMRIDAILK